MSAIGAVSGNGVYSELEYKGKRFKVAQWFNDAMDAVGTHAFRIAGRAAKQLGGTEREIAQRENALARAFSLGAYNFDSIINDGGLANPELFATFLCRLLQVHDSTVTYELAMEMIKTAPDACVDAVAKANPRSGLTTTPEAAVQN